MTSTEGEVSGGIGGIFRKWVVGLNGAGTIWIFALMVLINTDVLLRAVFNAPIDGVPEMVELSDAVRAGRLTRSDGLYNRVTANRPRLGHVLGLIFDIAGAAFFFAILCGAVPKFIEAWTENHYAGSEGIITIPVWPIRLILCVACVTVIFVFFGFIKKHIVALKNKEVASS